MLKDFPLTNPTVVIFNSSAILSASSVGADFEMTIDTPSFAAFNRTSDDIRPLKTRILSLSGIR